MTKNNNTIALMCVRNCNEYSLNPLTRINWRTSLVPAPAVIPAPIAYIKVVVVKKLVVGSQSMYGGLSQCVFTACTGHIPVLPSGGALHRVSSVVGTFTLKKLECSKRFLHDRILLHGIMK